MPILVSSFVLLFSIHSIGLLIYLTKHKNTVEKSYRDDMVQEVMNIIHMVQATPTTQLPRAIQSLETSRVNVTLSDKPTFILQVTDLTFWRINKLVNEHTHGIQLSLAVPSKRWVNVNATFEKSPSILPHLLILFSELLMALIVLFYAWSINRFTKPLKDFQRVAEGLGMQVKTTPLEVYKGPKVIRETSQAMNEMQQRIKDLIDDRTMMLAAISHDLRTPITRLKLRAHLFEDKTLTKQTLDDLDTMEKMISEILIFSKNENEDETKRKLDLNALLQTICDDLSDLGLPVTYHPYSKRLPYLTRELKFKRAIINLIQNAVKYGHKSEVKLRLLAKNCVITIEDNGPGIAKEEREKVFMPFYRCDHSRSRKIAGTGLGLAIAKSAIRSHGGNISLTNQKKGGLKVIITLPY